MGLVIRELDPDPALQGVIIRASDFHERAAPLRRLEAPLLGVVMVVSPGVRHAVAQRLLTRRLMEDESGSPEVRRVLGRLRASHGAARVEGLAAEAGWSRRHLSARFRAEVGLPPKTVARLARAEHAARLLSSGRPLADAAYSAGYADQPHFNRDFHELVGCPPGAFPFVQDMPLAA